MIAPYNINRHLKGTSWGLFTPLFFEAENFNPLLKSAPFRAVFETEVDFGQIFFTADFGVNPCQIRIQSA